MFGRRHEFITDYEYMVDTCLMLQNSAWKVAFPFLPQFPVTLMCITSGSFKHIAPTWSIFQEGFFPSFYQQTLSLYLFMKNILRSILHF